MLLASLEAQRVGLRSLVMSHMRTLGASTRGITLNASRIRAGPHEKGVRHSSAQLQMLKVFLWRMVASENYSGNLMCWAHGYSFSACCGGQEEAEAAGCWSHGGYSYEFCCLERYSLPRRCRDAAAASDRLWHCRLRPHRQTQRCFDVAQPEKLAVKTLYSGSYVHYVQLQGKKAQRELNDHFISQEAAEVIALYLAREGRPEIFGLCHGAKAGYEVRLLRKALERLGVAPAVLGTDISPPAAEASKRDVFNLDFHQRVPEWLRRWDFVYSNALDHSYDPLRALRAWREQLRSPESLLVLEHSVLHESCLETSRFRSRRCAGSRNSGGFH